MAGKAAVPWELECEIPEPNEGGDRECDESDEEVMRTEINLKMLFF
jgi:hypothetical protein